MNIKEFISKYKNHPILFIGTGLSLRYLNNSYSWDKLLEKICLDFKNEKYFLELKHKYSKNSDLSKVAEKIEKDFERSFEKIRKRNLFEITDEEITDEYYKRLKEGNPTSRFKIYISHILKKLDFKNNEELIELKKMKKNISSVITTNYDTMIEELFSFKPLIGNDILLSNPYGSVYKIHGCVSQPDKIIITEKDYNEFNLKYELIRAQLLSLFIHNPIIFLGYSISDSNIKTILKTIFNYVDNNSILATKIKNNFLLVEYEGGANNLEVLEHDIDLEGYNTIRINKIKTDNFLEIYKNISELQLPISVMDIRKVQSIVKEICNGGKIKVNIVENIDDLNNSEKVLAIGSSYTLKYCYQTTKDFIKDYFKIIEENNVQLLNIIDKLVIQCNQYFPIFGFYRINKNIERFSNLKQQQERRINNIKNKTKVILKKDFYRIDDIINDEEISKSNKEKFICMCCLENKLDLSDFSNYLKSYVDKNTITSDYTKMLCVYDYVKYSETKDN